MNNYQKSICDIIVTILKMDDFRKNHRSNSYKYIFGQIIRQYAEINSNYQKTWKHIELCKEYHKFTERAVSLLENNSEMKDKEIWQLLHYEHIVPISLLIKQLTELDENHINFENVANIMSQNEVIIMTMEEACVLDGQETKDYLLDGCKVKGQGKRSKGNRDERLKAINAAIRMFSSIKVKYPS